MNPLLIRRRGITAATGKQVITLNQEDFLYKYGNSYAPPYYSSNAARIIYPYFDLFINETGSWQFDLDTNYSTAQIGFRFFTQDTLDKVSLSQNIQNTYYDSGWRSKNVVLNIPSTSYGSPIVGFTVTIRQSTSNPSIANDFIINSFIAKKL